MRPEVSPLFHGRDVFAPAAAHLSCEALIMKDDYGRIEIAINMGRFVDRVEATIGSPVLIELHRR